MLKGVFCIEPRADADIQLLEKVTADDKSMPLFEHMNVFFVMDDNEGCC